MSASKETRTASSSIGKEFAKLPADGSAGDYLLYAEDNATDAVFFKRAMKASAPDVPILHFENGNLVREYLEQCRTEGCPLPRLMVLDIKMPGMTGLDLLKWVRAQPDYTFLPIILLSASYEEVDLKKAYRHRVNAYLVKPNRYSELKELTASLTTFWARFNKIIPA